MIPMRTFLSRTSRSSFLNAGIVLAQTFIDIYDAVSRDAHIRKHYAVIYANAHHIELKLYLTR